MISFVSAKKWIGKAVLGISGAICFGAPLYAQDVGIEFRGIAGPVLTPFWSPGDPVRLTFEANAGVGPLGQHAVDPSTLLLTIGAFSMGHPLNFEPVFLVNPNVDRVLLDTSLNTDWCGGCSFFSLYVNLRAPAGSVITNGNLGAQLGTSTASDWSTLINWYVEATWGQPSIELTSLTISEIPQRFCSATVNSTGVGAEIRVDGSQSVAANDFSVRAEGVPPNVVGIFLYGETQIPAPFPALGDGVRCVGGQVCRLTIGTADSNGIMESNVPLGPGGNPNFPICDILLGSTWNFQTWYRDPGSTNAGSNLSDAVAVEFYE